MWLLFYRPGDDDALVNTMLESVLSKELLYPSLKELCDCYPVWLQQQGTRLAPTERERYEAQHRSIAAICLLFEQNEKPQADVILRHIDQVSSWPNVSGATLPPKDVVRHEECLGIPCV